MRWQELAVLGKVLAQCSPSHTHMHAQTHTHTHTHTHTESARSPAMPGHPWKHRKVSLPLPSRRLALSGDLKAWTVDTQWDQNHKETGQVPFPHKSEEKGNEQGNVHKWTGNVQIQQMVVLLELKHGIFWSYQHHVWNNNLIKAFNRKMCHQ